MNGERFFLDTNILVYAYDTSAGVRHEKAARLVNELWDSRSGSLSTQVLQEFINSVTKRISKPLDVTSITEIVSDLLKWEVVVNDGDIVLEALHLHKKHKLSYWDALIVCAARHSSAHTLLSEDFSHDIKIQGILIQNPFL